MPEDENKTEMVNTQPQAAEMEAQPTEQQAETAEQLRARLAELEKRNRELNRESAERRKKLEQFETERKAKEQAELSELEKAQKRAAELEAKLTALETNEIKRRIAAEIGLPEPLALRLQGASEEELRADAETLKKSLPVKPAAPNTGATNPGANGNAGETDDQRRARLRGTSVDVFNPRTAMQYGGGVFFDDKQSK